MKKAKKGEKRRMNVIKLPKFEHFILCKTLAISQNKNDSKKSEKKFEKELEGKEKVVPLHSQNDGSAGLERRGVLRSSLRE